MIVLWNMILTHESPLDDPVVTHAHTSIDPSLIPMHTSRDAREIQIGVGDGLVLAVRADGEGGVARNFRCGNEVQL